MTNLRITLLTIICFNITTLVCAQDSKIVIPAFQDKYSKYVKQLEDGDLNIDYTDFRNSFLDSKQFSNKGTNYDSLKKEVYKEIKNKHYQGVINATKAMLSIDYTSMLAVMLNR